MGTEGIVENGGVGWTCQRCIGDRYLTSLNILQGDLYSISFARQLNHQDHPPDPLLVRCIACALLDHDSHDLLMGIPKQFLLPVIDTFRYLVQLLVPAGSFALVFPCTILVYHLWHNIYPSCCPWCPRVLG